MATSSLLDLPPGARDHLLGLMQDRILVPGTGSRPPIFELGWSVNPDLTLRYLGGQALAPDCTTSVTPTAAEVLRAAACFIETHAPGFEVGGELPDPATLRLVSLVPIDEGVLGGVALAKVQQFIGELPVLQGKATFTLRHQTIADYLGQLYVNSQLPRADALRMFESADEARRACEQETGLALRPSRRYYDLRRAAVISEFSIPEQPGLIVKYDEGCPCVLAILDTSAAGLTTKSTNIGVFPSWDRTGIQDAAVRVFERLIPDSSDCLYTLDSGKVSVREVYEGTGYILRDPIYAEAAACSSADFMRYQPRSDLLGGFPIMNCYFWMSDINDFARDAAYGGHFPTPWRYPLTVYIDRTFINDTEHSQWRATCLPDELICSIHGTSWNCQNDPAVMCHEHGPSVVT